MKKLFSFFAAVLMAGSMMAEEGSWSYQFVDTKVKVSATDSTFTINEVTWKLDLSGAKGTAAMPTASSKSTISGVDYYVLKLGSSGSNYFAHVGLVTEDFADKIVDSVAINIRNNGSQIGTLTIKQGGEVIGTHTQAKKSSDWEVRGVKCSGSTGGTLDLGYEVPQASFIEKIEVFYHSTTGSSIAKPVFDVEEGSYYDPQTIHLSCATEGAAFYYTTDGTEPTQGSSLYYPQYGIYLDKGTTTTIKAITYNNDSDNPEFSAVVTKTYSIAAEYDSFDELVTKAGAPAEQKVVVNFEKVVIDSIYTTQAGYNNGVYLTAAERMVEIFCHNVPAEWAVGGTISGTVKGEWKEWNGIWEVCPSSWEGISYKAALPEGPAITVDVEAGTFSITPANEEDIYIFMLLDPSTPMIEVSKEFAEMMAEAMVSDISADFTLAEYIDEGAAYQGAIETTSLDKIGELDKDVTYALVAFTLAENNPVAHTAEITSKVTYVEFLIPGTTSGINNVKVENLSKTIVNGELVIVKDGVRYNVLGARK